MNYPPPSTAWSQMKPTMKFCLALSIGYPIIEVGPNFHPQSPQIVYSRNFRASPGSTILFPPAKSLPSCRRFGNNWCRPVPVLVAVDHNHWFLYLKVPGQFFLSPDYPCRLCGAGILCTLLVRTSSPKGRNDIVPEPPGSFSSLEARVWDHSQNEEGYWPNCG